MREEIIRVIREKKLIVIVRGVKREQLIPLGEAVFKGGARLIELTYDPSGKVSDEEMADNVRLMAEHFKGRMHIGSGTVLSPLQVEMTKKAGGEFIVSPDVCPEVIKRTIELDMVSLPGAMTPTEIAGASRLGADFIKLFPAGTLGPAYVKAVLAPLNNVEILGVGGIDADNLPAYLKAGLKGLGVGSNIVKKELLEKEDYEEITALTRAFAEGVLK